MILKGALTKGSGTLQLQETSLSVAGDIYSTTDTI